MAFADASVNQTIPWSVSQFDRETAQIWVIGQIP